MWIEFFVRFMDRVHEFHIMERKTSQKIHVVQGVASKDCSNYQP